MKQQAVSGNPNLFEMRLFLLAVCFLMFLGISTPFTGLAQSALPTINADSGGAPSEPGMYLQTAQGFTKILGQIVSFTRSGSLLVSKLTIGIKTKKQNVQLLGPHAQM